MQSASNKEPVGRGRGRGKKKVYNTTTGDREVESKTSPNDKDYLMASHQKSTNEKQRKKVTDKARKSKRPDQALYVPKSRKPDQALYVPRSKRNQDTLPSETTDPTTNQIGDIETNTDTSENEKIEPPLKKMTINKSESQIMASVGSEPKAQESDEKAEDVVRKDHQTSIPIASELANDSNSDNAGVLEKRQSSEGVPSHVMTSSEGVPSHEMTSPEGVPLHVMTSSEGVSLHVMTSSEGVPSHEMTSPEGVPSHEMTSPDESDERIVSGEHCQDNSNKDLNNEIHAEQQTRELQEISEDQNKEEAMSGISSEDIVNKDICKDDDLSKLKTKILLEDVSGEERHAKSASTVANGSNIVDKDINLIKEQDKLSAINIEISGDEEKGESEEEVIVEDELRDQEMEESAENMEESGEKEEDDDLEEDIADTEISGDAKAVEASASAELTADGDDGDNWDDLFDETGEALGANVVDEISEAIGNVKVSVKKTKQDYYNYAAKDNFDYGRFNHVIEIYDFPAEFKTEDLVQSFSGYSFKSFNIQWVDETHALGVFSSASTAQDALGLQNPMLRTRSLDQATRDSKLKARKCIEIIQPAKPRPETSVSAARRLVTGALGVKSKQSKEQKAAEFKKLKDAKEKKKADKRLSEDVWEGNTWRL
ncbi:uncharacterized protein [Antedon mediterranea]|uniref:uncharacterized protein n=1 Tax=Antedon mediterranea TaxID=105859 RepID=UPI003AF63CA1